MYNLNTIIKEMCYCVALIYRKNNFNQSFDYAFMYNTGEDTCAQHIHYNTVNT